MLAYTRTKGLKEVEEKEEMAQWGRRNLRKIVFLFTLHMNLAGRYVGWISLLHGVNIAGPLQNRLQGVVYMANFLAQHLANDRYIR